MDKLQEQALQKQAPDRTYEITIDPLTVEARDPEDAEQQARSMIEEGAWTLCVRDVAAVWIGGEVMGKHGSWERLLLKLKADESITQSDIDAAAAERAELLEALRRCRTGLAYIGDGSNKHSGRATRLYELCDAAIRKATGGEK